MRPVRLHRRRRRGGNPTVESNVADDKKVSDLSADEVQAICDAASEAAASLMTPERTCRLFAVIFTEGPAQCRQITAQCGVGGGGFQPGGDDEPEPEEECLLDDEAKRQDCDATVAELETCMTDSLAVASEALDQLSCDLAGQDVTELDDLSGVSGGGADVFGAAQDAAEQPPSCAKVAAKCPELIRELGPSDSADATPPAADAGPSDAGASDAGPPTPDGAPSAPDAGTPMPDGGHSAPDAGTP